MAAFTSYEVDNDKVFAAALKRAGKLVNDLRIPLTSIRSNFYRSQKSIFNLKSKGKYPDFASEASRMQKIRAVGFDYPLLKRSGDLEKSTTTPNHPNSISKVIGKKTLIIGTSLPYAIFHQSDKPRTTLPLRKFLFIGPEAKQFANNNQIGRLSRWTRILEDYVLKVTTGAGVGST